MVNSAKTAIRVFRVDTPHELQTQLQQSVRRQMLDSVRVEVSEDGIELSGFVHTWYEKQLAQEAVRQNAATRQIRNFIHIAGGA